MKTERRITREDGEMLVHQVVSALDSGLVQARVQWADTELLLERVSDQEVTLRAPDQLTHARFFLAASATPEGYPVDLPFVPGEAVMITGPSSSQVLIWWAPQDAGNLIDVLDQQCTAAGWEFLNKNHWPDAPATRRFYKRDGSTMYILESGGMVTLSHDPREQRP